MIYALAPLSSFCLWLANGWEFPNMIAEPCIGHHGAWSVWLRRKDRCEGMARANQRLQRLIAMQALDKKLRIMS